MDYIFVHFLGQRSIFGKYFMEQVLLMNPNTHIVAVFEVCSSARKFERRERDDANSSAITKESKDPISLRILVPPTIAIHVDPHTNLSSRYWLEEGIVLASGRSWSRIWPHVDIQVC
jgi:hypothetical protein